MLMEKMITLRGGQLMAQKVVSDESSERLTERLWLTK